MANRRRTQQGRFSILRIALIIGVLGVAVVAAGVVAFFSDQASRQVPLEVAPYPGALFSGERKFGENRRQQYFRVVDATPDVVTQYYQQKLNEHYGNSDEQCVRVPREGEMEIQEGVNAVPYYFRCNFDRSGFFASQYTTVTIFPGMHNDDPDQNTEGMTVVEYDQYWQPAS